MLCSANRDQRHIYIDLEGHDPIQPQGQVIGHISISNSGVPNYSIGKGSVVLLDRNADRDQRVLRRQDPSAIMEQFPIWQYVDVLFCCLPEPGYQ